MKKMKYVTMSDIPVGSSISEIRQELAKIGVNGMEIDCRYDVNSGMALVKFKWQGRQFERRSTGQPNASKNMRVICLNLKHKVLDHLRGVEDFGMSMQAYLALEGEVSPDAPQGGAPTQATPEIIDAYAVIGVSPYATKEQCEAAYKRHIKAWHPDRFQNDETMKHEAENQSAKINDAWMKIKKHRGI